MATRATTSGGSNGAPDGGGEAAEAPALVDLNDLGSVAGKSRAFSDGLWGRAYLRGPADGRGTQQGSGVRAAHHTHRRSSSAPSANISARRPGHLAVDPSLLQRQHSGPHGAGRSTARPAALPQCLEPHWREPEKCSVRDCLAILGGADTAWRGVPSPRGRSVLISRRSVAPFCPFWSLAACYDPVGNGAYCPNWRGGCTVSRHDSTSRPMAAEDPPEYLRAYADSMFNVSQARVARAHASEIRAAPPTGRST